MDLFGMDLFGSILALVPTVAVIFMIVWMTSRLHDRGTSLISTVLSIIVVVLLHGQVTTYYDLTDLSTLVILAGLFLSFTAGWEQRDRNGK